MLVPLYAPQREGFCRLLQLRFLMPASCECARQDTTCNGAAAYIKNLMLTQSNSYATPYCQVFLLLRPLSIGKKKI